MANTLDLGKQAKDKLTGFAGIIAGKSTFITGCDQFFIQPPVGEKGEFKEGRWFDEGRLEVIGDGIEPAKVQGQENGCDIASPIK